jgi:hypothetical protein
VDADVEAAIAALVRDDAYVFDTSPPVVAPPTEPIFEPTAPGALEATLKTVDPARDNCSDVQVKHWQSGYAVRVH